MPDFEPLERHWVEVEPDLDDSNAWIQLFVDNPYTLIDIDCPCNPVKEGHPDYESQPFDVSFTRPGDPIPCPRCGRLFKLQLAHRVMMYTPIAVREREARNAH